MASHLLTSPLRGTPTDLLGLLLWFGRSLQDLAAKESDYRPKANLDEVEQAQYNSFEQRWGLLSSDEIKHRTCHGRSKIDLGHA